jgi:hypothetical protein
MVINHSGAAPLYMVMIDQRLNPSITSPTGAMLCSFITGQDEIAGCAVRVVETSVVDKSGAVEGD